MVIHQIYMQLGIPQSLSANVFDILSPLLCPFELVHLKEGL